MYLLLLCISVVPFYSCEPLVDTYYTKYTIKIKYIIFQMIVNYASHYIEYILYCCINLNENKDLPIGYIYLGQFRTIYIKQYRNV